MIGRTPVILFVASFGVLAAFSSSRFLRQSAAPHFVYQGKAWLEGRLDIDPSVLPNLEDWACVREVLGHKVRCEGRPVASDKWYVSFPPFPAAAMLPAIVLHGYHFNDTSFTVLMGALAIAVFYLLLKRTSEFQLSIRREGENAALALLLGFGTLFFYCAIRGEVWFTAEILGVLLTSLYLKDSIGLRHPFRAGVFYSMATLTRTPLFFTGLFFLLECHREQVHFQFKKLIAFAAGALPLAALAATYNGIRFGNPVEFGHRFLFNNRVNQDIDAYGLFNLHYLPRNLEAAFLKLPIWHWKPFHLSYDADGLSLLLTLPWLIFLLIPKRFSRFQWNLWATAALCAVPGLFYQNTGRMQFGFRFSLDYTPYLILLLALGGWSLKSRWMVGALTLAVVINVWGAVAFSGYTEWVRHGM